MKLYIQASGRLDRSYMDEFVAEMVDYFDGRTYDSVEEILEVLNIVFGYNNNEVIYMDTNDVIKANDNDHTGPFYLSLDEAPYGRISVVDIYW